MSNIAPVSSDKMVLIRSLACCGITDQMVREASEYALSYAMHAENEMDFMDVVGIAVRCVLQGGTENGKRSN